MAPKKKAKTTKRKTSLRGRTKRTATERKCIQKKVDVIMEEYKAGKLLDYQGKVVPKGKRGTRMALAIAYSKGRKACNAPRLRRPPRKRKR